MQRCEGFCECHEEDLGRISETVLKLKIGSCPFFHTELFFTMLVLPVPRLSSPTDPVHCRSNSNDRNDSTGFGSYVIHLEPHPTVILPTLMLLLLRRAQWISRCHGRQLRSERYSKWGEYRLSTSPRWRSCGRSPQPSSSRVRSLSLPLLPLSKTHGPSLTSSFSSSFQSSIGSYQLRRQQLARSEWTRWCRFGRTEKYPC